MKWYEFTESVGNYFYGQTHTGWYALEFNATAECPHIDALSRGYIKRVQRNAKSVSSEYLISI